MNPNPNRKLPSNARSAPSAIDAIPTFNEKELKWIQITASLVSLIGLVALFAMMAQSAHAADNGFNPGSRPFPSPFGNQPGGGAPPPFFDDEEDVDFGGGFPGDNFNPPPPPMQGGSQQPAPRGGSPSGGGSTSSSSNSALSGGGSPLASGVISNKKVNAIPLDAETGEGGREMVSDFNFPDADIMDIAKTLGKLTGKNFIFDKDVKGRISIISNSPITVSDAWKAFLTALDMNGFALIPSGKYIRIARQRDARAAQGRRHPGSLHASVRRHDDGHAEHTGGGLEQGVEGSPERGDDGLAVGRVGRPRYRSRSSGRDVGRRRSGRGSGGGRRRMGGGVGLRVAAGRAGLDRKSTL